MAQMKKDNIFEYSPQNQTKRNIEKRLIDLPHRGNNRAKSLDHQTKNPESNKTY